MSTAVKVYDELAARTGGDIYIGVVGPVRTGKSTFIQKFMETVVLPNIEDDGWLNRAVDEMPQSASGRTIMTTEPKFIPEQAVSVRIDSSSLLNVRLIDCVGYIVPSALGYVEENAPRMVMTPWFDEPVPFNMAAELGTQKVITEHSTIGLVVTTDGSISDIPREEYEEAEERVIHELQELHKPFAVLLNCMEPRSPQAMALRDTLTEKYGVPVDTVNCLDLTEEEIRTVLTDLLYEFPVREVRLAMPPWMLSLPRDHWLRSNIMNAVRNASGIRRVKEIPAMLEQITGCEYVRGCTGLTVNLGSGCAAAEVDLPQSLFYRILSEKSGLELHDESELLACLVDMAETKKKFAKIQQAYDDVCETGYGIVMPDIDELTLEEPTIIRQGGKYGIRLRAGAPSIHMMKTAISTEVTPIVGSEQQSEELVRYLLREFEESPGKIWESNIFGKSLHELVNEGMHNKLYRMPEDAREKIRETIERIINDGCNGLICIIL